MQISTFNAKSCSHRWLQDTQRGFHLLGRITSSSSEIRGVWILPLTQEWSSGSSVPVSSQTLTAGPQKCVQGLFINPNPCFGIWVLGIWIHLQWGIWVLGIWIHLQCGRPGFNSWVGKIPWRSAWQPTPVFLPGESHGLRSLVGYSPWGLKESDTTERLTLEQLTD